jgi:hypothetical protein
MDQFKNMYGCKPKEYTSPLEKGDHPEVDTSEELDEEDIKKYETILGFLQWAVALGHFDIQTATMTMSRLRDAPIKVYTERLKRMYGYLKKFSLRKRKNALAYHRVRELIAANILGYYWVDGKNNPADCVSKHWSYPHIWHLLKPFLFYSGNTPDLLDIKENDNLMDNRINASSQEASYHMFLTYNDEK